MNDGFTQRGNNMDKGVKDMMIKDKVTSVCELGPLKLEDFFLDFFSLFLLCSYHNYTLC